MIRFRKTLAIALSVVMLGSIVHMKPAGYAYAAETETESAATLTASYSGLGVETHTESEIIQFIKGGGALLTDEVAYETAYSDSSPYSAGKLTDETLDSAIAMLNNMRYIAGLDANVTLDDDYTAACQAGALIGKLNGTIDHYPTQPDGMDDTLYALGRTGCSKANIAQGYSSLNITIVKAWMSDEDSSNVNRVGHRAWCLNPAMGKTGFGAVDNYYNMYAIDGSNSTASASSIAWPAQNMPVEYFDYDMPWSIFTGTTENADDISITLTRKSDGRTWTFSSATESDTSTTGSSESQLYFGVCDSSKSVQAGTIVFRPDGITSYTDGDEFTVTVDGTKTPLSYTVKFFSLGDELGHEHTYENKTISLTPDFDTMTGTAGMQCDSCDYVSSGDMTITSIDSGEFKCGYTGYISYSFKAQIAGVTWSGSNYVRYKDGGVPHKYGEPEFVWDGTSCTVELTCVRCGETSDDTCEVTAKVAKDATCEAAGRMLYTAAYGEYTDTVETDTAALGHTFTDYESDNNATCDADGTETARCVRAGDGCTATDTRTEAGSALSHDYTDYVSNGDATCMKDGTETAHCNHEGCDATYTRIEQGSKKAHSYTEYVPDNNAGCLTAGTKTAYCDFGCGNTDTIEDESSSPLGHSWSEYTSNGDATCMKDGTKTSRCTNSGCDAEKTVTDTGSMKPHSFTEYSTYGEATCVKDGTLIAYCDYGCGETDIKADEGSYETGAHSWSEYEYNNDATCTKNGTETAFCKNCGKLETREKDGTMLEHSYKEYEEYTEATCTADATERAYCDYGCGQTDIRQVEGTKLEHSYTWVTTAKATAAADGTKEYTCKDCGYVSQTKAIAMIKSGRLSYTSCIYDGTEKKPSVSIMDSDGNVIDSSSYTVTYENNTEAGVATIRFVFSGDYQGRVYTTFVIRPKATSITGLTNTAAGVTVTWNKAASGTGYILYRSTNGGNYTRVKTIAGLGTNTYIDTAAKKNGAKYSYKIYVYKSVDGSSYRSSLSAAKTCYYIKAPTWKSLTNAATLSARAVYYRNSSVTGYQIQYSTSGRFTSGKVITLTNNSKTTATISRLTRNKRYYVRVRSYKKVGNAKYYSAWNSAKNIVIKK